MMKRWGIWWRALVDLLLPRVCLVCGRKLGLQEEHLCLHCLADMPRTYFWNRSHNAMADKFNSIIQDGLQDSWPDMLEEDIKAFPPFVNYAYACSLFFYKDEGDYRHILYSLKYGGNTEAGEYFGRMLGGQMAKAAHFADVDAVVPVPLHWTRRWKRGYNQAESIARTVASELGAELRTDLLYRRRRTSTQTKVDVDKKGRNVMGAFEAMKSKNSPIHIVLVDDLFTSGSTLYACYSAIKEAYPCTRISVATLGYVGRP
ncbi:MAG: ComF family protein [Bacteroidales bacterium]|nr:ComF family protein [Bacteroidales bacterium]